MFIFTQGLGGLTNVRMRSGRVKTELIDIDLFRGECYTVYTV